MEKDFQAHVIYEKLLCLDSLGTYPVSEDVKQALGAIDRAMIDIMLSAEKGLPQISVRTL